MQAKPKQKLQCEALNDRGLPCGSWAVRGETLCHWHSMEPEERLAMTRKGAARSIIVRQQNAAARQKGSNRFRPDGVTLGLAMHAMRQLLTGTLEGADPNLEQRALGLQLFGVIFRQPDRDSAFELLNRRSPHLANGLDLSALDRFRHAQRQLLEDVNEGRVELGDLTPEIRELLSARPW